MLTDAEAAIIRDAYRTYLNAPANLAKTLQAVYRDGQDRPDPVTQDDIAQALPISRQATGRWLNLDVDELLRRLHDPGGRQ